MGISKAEYIKDIKSHFSSFYYMIISVIQGLTFGFLAHEVLNEAGNKSFLYYLYAICMLLIIMAIIFEYMTIIVLFNWSVRFIDISIPFAFCITELFLIKSFENPSVWFKWIAILFVIAIIAYINTYRLINELEFPILNCQEGIYQSSKKVLVKSIKMSFAGVIIFFTASWIFSTNKFHISNTLVEYIFILVNIAAILMFVKKEQIWFKSIHKKLNLTYKHFF